MLLPEQDERRGRGAACSRGMMSPPYFPIEPTELRGRVDVSRRSRRASGEIEGFTVLAREIPHKGGRTFGYRISDGHSTLTYMPDHCPTALGPGEDGFGEYHPAALELARDADVLSTTRSCSPRSSPRKRSFGHAAADYAVGARQTRRARARSCCSTTAPTAPTRRSTGSRGASRRRAPR